jgi:hypothetical protein
MKEVQRTGAALAVVFQWRGDYSMGRKVRINACKWSTWFELCLSTAVLAYRIRELPTGFWLLYINAKKNSLNNGLHDLLDPDGAGMPTMRVRLHDIRSGIMIPHDQSVQQKQKILGHERPRIPNTTLRRLRNAGAAEKAQLVIFSRLRTSSRHSMLCNMYLAVNGIDPYQCICLLPCPKANT